VILWGIYQNLRKNEVLAPPDGNFDALAGFFGFVPLDFAVSVDVPYRGKNFSNCPDWQILNPDIYRFEIAILKIRMSQIRVPKKMKTPFLEPTCSPFF